MWAQVFACLLQTPDGCTMAMAGVASSASGTGVASGVFLELLVFLVGLFVIWLGLQVCGEFWFVVLAVARCYWQISLDVD